MYLQNILIIIGIFIIFWWLFKLNDKKPKQLDIIQSEQIISNEQNIVQNPSEIKDSSPVAETISDAVLAIQTSPSVESQNSDAPTPLPTSSQEILQNVLLPQTDEIGIMHTATGEIIPMKQIENIFLKPITNLLEELEFNETDKEEMFQNENPIASNSFSQYKYASANHEKINSRNNRNDKIYF